MIDKRKPHSLLMDLRLILWHGTITLLAVGIAFSLPSAARYILYGWWPRVANDTNLLLVTEIGLASLLVLLFSFVRILWHNRQRVANARLAALVHARHSNSGWLTRWRERGLARRLPVGRDAYVLTLTGYDTFVDKGSTLREALAKAYEIRVLLANPTGEGLRRRAESLPPDTTLQTLHAEIEASIGYLTELRRCGKRVTLKFYDHEPFWKVVVLGDHVWVQHCHAGFKAKQLPEFVFALQHQRPHQGMYVPFYMYFLDHWGEAQHPEYDFATHELVYRDKTGSEIRRAPLGIPINGAARRAAQSWSTSHDAGPDVSLHL
jgi:hypothetical protein